MGGGVKRMTGFMAASLLVTELVRASAMCLPGLSLSLKGPVSAGQSSSSCSSSSSSCSLTLPPLTPPPLVLPASSAAAAQLRRLHNLSSLNNRAPREAFSAPSLPGRSFSLYTLQIVYLSVLLFFDKRPTQGLANI